MQFKFKRKITWFKFFLFIHAVSTLVLFLFYGNIFYLLGCGIYTLTLIFLEENIKHPILKDKEQIEKLEEYRAAAKYWRKQYFNLKNK